ncbi:hypothetical protein QBC35DRAFT_542418 [Podospora australis]|uniref:Reverse transcriptase domain-containing protein n=1 Tax=Podospora australis TaxID=1536484 RepID=A0AAN6WZ54_9PEZI|nr:hypothetical protein QBC35DRAFT_542418 [Podospora australis]
MASPKSVLSKTLQSITLSKIRELESRHKSYEDRKLAFLTRVDAASDERDQLAILIEAFRELDPGAHDDPSLANVERWLSQSRYDASIPVSKLASFGRQLRLKLDHQSRKLDMAHLYSRLLTEWMDQYSAQPAPAPNADEDGDSFEVVERQRQRLSELVDKFESVVFTPHETSDGEIRGFIDRLLPDEESQQALEALRKTVADETSRFMSETSPFDEESLTSCIRGLLAEDILSDEKQAILREFLESKVAKAEIADVLNMRFSDIKRWHWDAGSDGIRVVPRAGLNGKYRVWADDDIMQMIFVQYIGVRLCNIIKPALKTFMSTVCAKNLDGPWAPSEDDMIRRRHYLSRYAPKSDENALEARRPEQYFETFFLSQLPATETSLYDEDRYDDDDESNSADTHPWDMNAPKQKRSSIKQQLLRRLTSELIVHRLRGVTHDTRKEPGNGVALVQTDLQCTVFSVMRYIGFDQDWVGFFQKYLQSPLNLDAASDDRPQLGPRIRRRGVPMAHASEKLTGELVLFFVDLAVNRKTGILLYRLHDDIWLVGEPHKAAQAWKCMQEFAKVFGLEFNNRKTGSIYISGKSKRSSAVDKTLPIGPVRIGFLQLNPQTGKWDIDENLVVAHVDQLKKQLSDCKSVVSWVQTWNSCIGRFFSHTFGEPAYCFGREHVDNVLDTYTMMLRRLFPGANGKEGSVVEHLKGIIQDRFGVSNLPDSFIFLPEQLGGLGLRNPFIGLFLIRNKLNQTPDDIIDEYLKLEREEYLGCKKTFDARGEKALRSSLNSLYHYVEIPEDGAITELDYNVFFSLEEFSRFRERQLVDFASTFEKLVSVPETEEIALSKEVESELKAFLAGNVALDSERKWFLQLYAEELFENFGSLNLVDKQFLPVGVLEMMKSKKVNWNMVL